MGQFGSRDSGFFTNSQTTVCCQFITCCTINQCGVEVPDSGCCATVRCGANNCASGGYSATLGGRCNTSSSLYSAIVGGFCNTASGCNSFVGSGCCNTASGVCSFVGGGRSNTASGNSSTIVGGLENLACGGSSFVGGGCTNCAIADSSSIVGGVGNRACCCFSTIVGGGSNTANGNFSFIGGGSCNTASGCYSAILGGQNNHSCTFANSFIVGSNICALQACTTFVNNLSVCSFNSCSGCSVCIGANGVLLSTSNFGSLTLQQVTTNGNTSNVGISVTAGGVSTNTLNVTSLTTGSVPFVGSAGLITQDNPNLFWDDTNNRFGIGTTSPSYKFEVQGASNATTATSIAGFFSGPSSSYNLVIGQDAQNASVYGGSIRDLTIMTNNSGLHFLAESNAIRFSTYASAAWNQRMTILNNGNVLIGTTTDTGQKLQVNGQFASIGGQAAIYTQARDLTSNFAFYASFSTELFLYNSGPGNIGSFANTTGVYTPLSDINKKKDFENSEIGLNAILNLKPTLYRMISENGNSDKHLGFLAQEVKEFIPQAFVQKDDFIGLDYQAITATLVKAIQEQQQQIKELQSQINK